MSINDWAFKHYESARWVYNDIIHGLNRYGLDREKVINYSCLFNENDMLVFELLWSMILQVNPKTIEKAYPPPPHAIIYR